MPSDHTLRLLIAEDSLNDAERLVSVLRNVGYAVRPTRTDDGEALQAALHGQAQDILICAPGLTDLPLDEALRVIQQSGHDLGVLVLTEAEDPELRREVMAMGVADLVTKADPDHFRYVVDREFAALQARRAQRRLEAALSESERRCENLLESSRDAIAYVHDGMHIYANHAYAERFGLDDREEVEGMPLLDLIAPTEQADFRERFRAYARDGETSAEIATRLRDANGEERDAHVVLTEGSWDGEHATQILIRGQQQNDDALAERLEHLSRQDMLTGLLNRNHFLTHLGKRLTSNHAEEAGTQHGLLYLRIDRSDTIQHNLGIGALDQVIADTADCLEAQLPEGAAPARYADTAFVALLPGANVHDALAVAESVREAASRQTSDVDGHTVNKTVSVGIAMIGDNVATAEQAVNLAAEAMDQAAREGGDRVHLHQGAAEAGDDTSALGPRLEKALSDGLIECLYQPVVGLGDDAPARYQLHYRLSDDDGLVDQATLSKAAAEAGLAAALDRYILDAGLRALAGQGGDGPSLFVPVCADSLADAGFETLVAAALDEHGLRPRQLIIELRESVAITQFMQIGRIAEAFSRAGIGLCLTEFGTGLDSFRILYNLPVGFVRLDPVLLEDLYAGRGADDHLNKLASAAHEAECLIIAEGLTEAVHIARLWQLNIDLMQGEFLQGPAPAMDYDFAGMVI
ncbi:EAL domain-containing protein [Arhodomonas aquaeolei]|uniref:EAL domain-containing protein n=1 Tax=Arhodomonas aquaeolei TaxID=2369 RepID=UPI002167CDB2|nr:EAL domain-containing protein [Arhodomonas aquaeolei]MCS4504403.1 EAL domain-containing protein [Arhodomonas aquaeolei]